MTNTKHSALYKFPVGYIILFCIFAIEIPVGFFFDIDVIVLISYATFLLYTYCKYPETVVLYLWYFLMSILMVLGVYACELPGSDLFEIARFGHYVNALSTICISYMIFFVALIIYQQRRSLINSSKRPKRATLLMPYYDLIGKIFLFIGLALELYLVLTIYNKPYFSVGVERYLYQTEVLSSFGLFAKGILPIFIPCAVIVFNSGKRLAPIVFGLLLGFVYVWTGDKFGTYLFAFAILIYCTLGVKPDNRRVIGKIFGTLLIFAVFLFVIGYVQRLILHGTQFPEYIEFLLSRLAGQGQAWWSIFDKTVTYGVGIEDLGNSLAHAFTPDLSREFPYAGQWKMLYEASDDLSYAAVRIANSVPLTATTQASLFFYFGWVGLFFVIPLAWLCCKLINELSSAIARKDCFVSMLLVKLIISFNAMNDASDLFAFFSVSSIVTLVLLYICYRPSTRKYSNEG